MPKDKQHNLPKQVNLALAKYDTTLKGYNTQDSVPFGFVLLHLDKNSIEFNELHQSNNDVHTLSCVRLQIQHDYDSDELCELCDGSDISATKFLFYYNNNIVNRNDESNCILNDNDTIICITPDMQQSGRSAATSPHTAMSMMQPDTNQQQLQPPPPIRIPLDTLHSASNMIILM